MGLQGMPDLLFLEEEWAMILCRYFAAGKKNEDRSKPLEQG